MEKHWCYLLFLAWFSYLLVTQVLLFTNGFLLTRVTMLRNSTCEFQRDDFCVPNNDAGRRCEDPYNEKVVDADVCLPPRGKVVLLIVDALRYDFTLYNESLRNPLAYQNKMPAITELLERYPERSRLFKFIADPPTTTMQRLKGFTTGSLPTFIEAGSNFATHEINEDNLIDQVINGGYNAIFLGDDTWNGLYPNRFKRNYPFESFDVWDLDTVDNGVKDNIYKEMQKSDWNLIIGHLLGVDHVGHKHGPEHPEMERKLTEMDSIIKKVAEAIDEDTMLFVIGDHGMTATGDHGGETENEVSAAMFIHTKMNLTRPYPNHNDTVKQVDFVPTLSTILGIPIPHSNLGSIIYSALPATSWQQLLHAGWANVKQVMRYIEEYSKQSPETFKPRLLGDIRKKFEVLKGKMLSVKSESEFGEFTLEMQEQVNMIRDMCEEVWIQFDAYSMARGLLLISVVTIFMYLIVDGLSQDVLEKILSTGFISACYGSLILSAGFSFVMFYFKYVVNFFNTLYFTSGLLAILILAATVVKHFQGISLNLYESSKNRKWTDIVCRIIYCFSAIMLVSNSFILEEGGVMLFFIMTIIFVIVLDFLLTKSKKGKEISLKFLMRNKYILLAILITGLMRFSVYFWRCREDKPCESFGFNKGNYSGRIEWVLTTISLFLFVLASRVWLRACGNLNGFSPTVIFARYLPTISAICVVSFWVLHRLPKDTKTQLLGPWQPDMLAWVTYLFSVLGIVSTYIQPLAIYRLSPQSDYEVDSTNLIPQLAKQVVSNPKKRDRTPMVYGLATVYSAAFVIITVNLIILWSMVLGDIVVPSCVALTFVAIFILSISVVFQYEKAQNIRNLIEIPSTTLLAWYLMSIYIFYATGHQPTFPNIAWEAAFVGTKGVLHNNFIPAILVIYNTFGSFVIMGLTLPLLVIVPFSLFLMVPGLASRKNKLDLSRGDLVLYDNHEAVSYNIFKLVCRYIMCHTVRIFCSMLAATVHCRHLMVWTVFAPKLIFEAIGLFMTLGSVLFGFFLFIRVNAKVDRFIKYLNKQFS